MILINNSWYRKSDILSCEVEPPTKETVEPTYIFYVRGYEWSYTSGFGEMLVKEKVHSKQKALDIIEALD